MRSVFLPFSQRAKSWEPKALALRCIAGVGADEILDPWPLAAKVGLAVVSADDTLLECLSAEERKHLLGAGSKRWSGGVLPIDLGDGTRICILNPVHPHNRNKSTLMEEISHVHLGHAPTKLVFNEDGLTVRDFNDAQEKEAFGVGAAVLLPWRSFFHRINDGMTEGRSRRSFKSLKTWSGIAFRLRALIGCIEQGRARHNPRRF